jgi:predicted phosphodiesterase
MINRLSGKIAILSDINGNVIALKDVINSLQSHSPKYWCILEDTIGYFSDGNEVLDIFKELNPICVMGNHEAMLLSGAYVGKVEYYHLYEQSNVLRPEYRQWIQSWPEILTVKAGLHNVMMVHGSPYNHLNEYIYPDTDLSHIDFKDHDLILIGHTHRFF